MKLRILEEARVDALAAAFAVENARQGLGDAFQVLYSSRRPNWWRKRRQSS